MDSSINTWFPQLEMDDQIPKDHYDIMDSFDPHYLAVLLREDIPTVPPAGNTTAAPLCTFPPFPGPPPKRPRPHNGSGVHPTADGGLTNIFGVSSSAPVLLNFENANSAENLRQENVGRPFCPDAAAAFSETLCNRDHSASESGQAVKKTGRVRLPSQTQDHIISERKRRQQLSQRFVMLSAMVPGLKKMDKYSVLCDTIKYLKHLQDRIKDLEEQGTKQTVESVVFIRKSNITTEDGPESSGENSGGTGEQSLPEIEARACKNQILVRIHCEKRKGVVVNLLSKVESLNLTVVSTNVTPFGNLALYITIIAEMEREFNSTVKDVVNQLRTCIRLTQ